MCSGCSGGGSSVAPLSKTKSVTMLPAVKKGDEVMFIKYVGSNAEKDIANPFGASYAIRPNGVAQVRTGRIADYYLALTDDAGQYLFLDSKRLEQLNTTGVRPKKSVQVEQKKTVTGSAKSDQGKSTKE